MRPDIWNLQADFRPGELAYLDRPSPGEPSTPAYVDAVVFRGTPPSPRYLVSWVVRGAPHALEVDGCRLSRTESPEEERVSDFFSSAVSDRLSSVLEEASEIFRQSVGALMGMTASPPSSQQPPAPEVSDEERAEAENYFADVDPGVCAKIATSSDRPWPGRANYGTDEQWQQALADMDELRARPDLSDVRPYWIQDHFPYVDFYLDPVYLPTREDVVEWTRLEMLRRGRINVVPDVMWVNDTWFVRADLRKDLRK